MVADWAGRRETWGGIWIEAYEVPYGKRWLVDLRRLKK